MKIQMEEDLNPLTGEVTAKTRAALKLVNSASVMGTEEREAADQGLPPVLTVEEASRFLRVNNKTLYAGVSSGEVPGRRIGKRVVILRDALLKWMSSGCACCHHKKGDS
jgi:excisionase family DNA binding protein